MRLILATLTFVVIALLSSGCDKAGVSEAKTISEKDMKACDTAISNQEKSTKRVKSFADGALAGDVQQAAWWFGGAYVEPRQSDSNNQMTMGEVVKILRKPVEGDTEDYRALYKRYQGCIERMHEAGYGSGLPLVRAARLGVPVAQYNLYELLSGVVERNGGVKAGFVFNEQAGNHPYAYRHYSDYGPLSPLSVATDKLPVVEVLEPAMASPSHSYMLDLEWKAPTGPWDPMYKVGKFKYEDTVFSPHELLIKAAAEREEYRARLAAVNFISSNSAGGREAAAKVLLGLVDSRDWPLYDVLVNTCIATIHLRGIGSPVDFSKAAEVMLSSREGGLVARGIMLACRDSIPLNSDASLEWLPYVNDRIGKDLVDAASHQFGWGGRGRDLEKAYFHYFRFILKQRRGDSSDMRFARMRMSEIEKILSPDALLALQKNCYFWSSRWHDGDGPSYADWRDRYLTDQQKPR